MRIVNRKNVGIGASGRSGIVNGLMDVFLLQ